MAGADFAAVDEDGNINWPTAKAAGTDFVYLNATPGNSVWGQADAARAAGVEVGAYFFPVVRAVADAKAEVASWLEHFTDHEDNLPVCLDVELPHGIAGTGMTRAEVCAHFIALYWELRDRLGYAPLLYSSERVLDQDDTDTLAGGLNSLSKKAALWLARYGVDLPPAPTAWGAGNYWIHQYLGDQRNVPGFRQVDRDRFAYCREGEKGRRVEWLQTKLSAFGRPTVDGTFGRSTTDAVKALQTAHNLVADGIVGPRTFARIARMP